MGIVTRLDNTTNPVRVRELAERYQKEIHPDIAKYLREYADFLEETTTDNHVCVFNIDLTDHCMICGTKVERGKPEILRHTVLTGRNA